MIAILVLAALAALAWWIHDEIRTSRRQADWLHRWAKPATFELEPGASPNPRFPADGPYDARLGYHQLPQLTERLQGQGFAVTAQARLSPRMVELADEGLFLPYAEKTQAGLTVDDCRGEPLFEARVPARAYARFEAVPPLLVQALLFIENRDLLDAQQPRLNPALDWSRLSRAVVDLVWHKLDARHASPGGSTLATQIEKYRHSPDGRTDSVRDKLRQMASASLRAYQASPETMGWRRQIALDYLNTVPLSAKPGFGEVHGVGDGLWVWYGRDFDTVNRLLNAAPASDPTVLRQQAQAFKQALSLMVAQRRPSYYLGQAAGAADLARLTDSYLRLMAQAGEVPAALRDAALAQGLASGPDPAVMPTADDASAPSFVTRKAATLMRSRLSGLLDVPRAYDLDRLDLQARSSLHGEVQAAATRALLSLRDSAGAQAAGLYGDHLLKPGQDPSKLQLSFTLYERGEHANLLRVQTDNVDQPFDLNEGARLDLGSTAKLRTLVSYLEIVAELHSRWQVLDARALAALEIAPRDNLGRWARDHLLQNMQDRSLPAMLEAAMQRRYSASPAETFYTGGGQHTFENFEPEDNARILTVQEALNRSVNLVFIRLMRDVVYHLGAQLPSASPGLLSDPADPARRDYLARFADREGSDFLARFHRQYKGKTPAQMEEQLLQNRRATPVRLASLQTALDPQGGAASLAALLQRRLPGADFSAAQVQKLIDQYGPGQLSLPDRGYLAGVHPLELWLVAYLHQKPGATLAQVLAASAAERQEVYGWLFKTRHKNAQDVRIRNLLEQEAFMELQRRWARLGYPFEALTPSYASALGASGDRPAALAELMGVIVNRGMRRPVARIDRLVFAQATPYETHFSRRAEAGNGKPTERVLPEAVADRLRTGLLSVVESGTARRLKGVLKTADGQTIALGGKTGTGDHRFDTYGRGGQLISSRVVNRTATFVFLIGDRYWGTVMAYVHEPDAADFRFTSALPTQLLKSVLPAVLPLLESGGGCRAAPPAAPTMLRAS